jgi:cytochrome c oxidase cbb3-type subunit 3
MSEQQPEDRVLGHDYDGIEEYDNPLPRWWVTLFWITIVFSALYFVYFHFGEGKLPIEAYNEDMIAFYELQAQQLLALGEIKESTLLDLAQDDSMMAGGAQLFQAKCAQCHGSHAEGGIGPNLTDDYWLHGGRLTNIYRTITEGVPSKGMLAWKNQLRPAEILSLASYVGTLRGSNPAGAKAPQGELAPYNAQAILEEEAAADEGGDATGAATDPGPADKDDGRSRG